MGLPLQEITLKSQNKNVWNLYYKFIAYCYKIYIYPILESTYIHLDVLLASRKNQKKSVLNLQVLQEDCNHFYILHGDQYHA